MSYDSWLLSGPGGPFDFEPPTECVQCGADLAEDNETGVCGEPLCNWLYAKEQYELNEAEQQYAEQLAEDARQAELYWESLNS